MASLRRDRIQLERMLRRARPEAPDLLVESISADVRTQLRRRPMRLTPARVFALALTLTMLGTLASFGGIGYAASAASQAVSAVKRVAAPNPVVKAVQTPAQRQYGAPPICKKNQVLINGKCVPKCKANQRRVNRKCVRFGGVASATKTITSGSKKSSGVLGATASLSSGVLGTSTSKSNLPFTGLDLTLVLAGALLLLLAGTGLRQLARERE